MSALRAAIGSHLPINRPTPGACVFLVQFVGDALIGKSDELGDRRVRLAGSARQRRNEACQGAGKLNWLVKEQEAPYQPASSAASGLSSRQRVAMKRLPVTPSDRALANHRSGGTMIAGSSKLARR